MKGNDFEKLLVQINESIGVLGDKVVKNEVTGLIKETLLPQILNIKETLDRSGSLLTFPAPKWDEAESPSPLRKPPGTPSTVSEAISLKLSEDRSSVKSSAKSTKKKRKRSRSSSSSSSDDEVMDAKDLKQNVKIIGNKVSQIDLRLKEISKSLKKTTKMEDNSATVLKRVHEMAMGVQIIAENVDSMNDVGKRLDVIEDIKESLEDLESLPKRLKGLDEKVGTVSNSIASLSDMVSLKVRDIEGYLDGSKGRRCSTDEYGDVTNLLIKLEEENSKKFCEFGGLVETLQEAIVRRLEKMETSDGGEKGVKTYLNTLLDTHEKLIDHVKNVERIQKKEIVPGLNNLMSLGGVGLNVGAQPAVGSPSQNTERAAVSGGATDQRIAALVLQLSQLQPRLDDLYTRVLPSLENLTSRVRKVEDRERLAVSEDTQHIQKILDIVEDMKEERKTVKVEGGGGPDTSGGFKSLVAGQAEKLDDIFKAVYEARDAITNLHAESSASVKTGLSAVTGSTEKLLMLAESAGKMLDTLMKNSNSDAKTISGLNTSLQSMKASVNGVNTTAKDQLTTAKELRESLSNISTKVTDLEASSVAVETKLQTDVVAAFSTLKDDLWELIDHNVKEMIVSSTKEIIDSTTSKQPEPQHQTTKTASQAQLIKMQESLDKLISKVTLLEVNLNISNNSKSKSHAQTSSSSGVLQSKVSEDLDMLGKEIKSQLDDVHDMVASMEEKHGGLLEGIKNDLSVHDKHTGVSFNKIALVMRDILDNSKQAYEQIPGIETNIISAMKESSTLEIKGTISRLEAAIKESSKVPENKDILKMAEKLDQLNTKHDKIGKIVGRIKFLVEADDVEKDGKRVGLKKEVVEGAGGLEILINSLRSTVEDELNSQGDMLADITNHIQELSEKVATREVVKSIGDEIRQRMVDVGNGLTDLGGLVKEIPDQHSAQNTVLEENLAAAVLASMKEDSQKHFDGINDSLFEVENKLHGIKKLVKRGGGAEEKEEVGLKGVLDRVEEVSRRLETVQAVLENTAGGKEQGLDTALVLAEVRKRAESEGLDRLSQDMFKAVHNVQGRLLVEHKRLMNRLNEIETSNPDPATLQLITTFNKVQVIQADLLSKQDEGVTAQENTNRLLNRVVSTLELTRKLLSEDAGGQMTGRMSELCEELAGTVKNLISVQSSLSQNSCYEKLDSLLKTAAVQFKVESGVQPATANSTAAARDKRRTAAARRTSSPVSEPSSNDLDMDQTETRGRVGSKGNAENRRPRAQETRTAAETQISDEVMISPGNKK